LKDVMCQKLEGDMSNFRGCYRSQLRE